MRYLIPLLTLLSGAVLAQPVPTGQFLLRLEPTRPGFTLQNMTPDEARLAGQHAQYLMSLVDSGKLKLAAQAFDPKGFWGFVIVNTPDREVARALLEADPGVKGNMFRGEVIPLRVVFQQSTETAIAVDPKVLADYAGEFTLSPNFAIQVTVEGQRIYAQATAQPRIEIFAKSRDEFFIKGLDAQISFGRDDAGKVTHLVLHQNGMNQKAPKKTPRAD